jgi:hypothetical protein
LPSEGHLLFSSGFLEYPLMVAGFDQARPD